MKKSPSSSKKTVLMFHSRYRIPGGEEGSFGQEAQLFESMGFNVIRIEAKNADVSTGFRGAVEAIYNSSSYSRASEAIRKYRPDFIYVNNLWPALSPAVLWAARFHRVPTLQALRNYRILCPSAKLTNDGSCISCRSKNYPMSCILHRCYNNSMPQSIIVAAASATARIANAGRRNHVYLATSQTTKMLLTRGGLRPNKVRVRPNFLESPLAPSYTAGEGVIFVGRLSEEKGVRELVSAWMGMPNPPMLTIVGEGPLSDFVAAAASHESGRIKWLGSCPPDRVLQLVSESALAVVPSLWAEPFGRVAIEAMSVGTPVLHTDGGALSEIVGDTGILLPAISSAALEQALEILKNPRKMSDLRRASYLRYKSRYSADAARNNIELHIESVTL